MDWTERSLLAVVPFLFALLILAMIVWDYYDPVGRFLRRLRYEYIMREQDGEEVVYMTRRWLFGNNQGRRATKYALMLHQMHLPDGDYCHHDHPWSFWTLVLKGGYWEDVTLKNGTVKTRWNGPGTILYRPAEHTHRIRWLPEGECWTLVFRFPKRRSWGFHTSQGFVPWRDFVNLRGLLGVLWCGREDDDVQS